MKYSAFISYNSKDDRWAKWLQRKLESYHIPVKIRSEKDEEVIRKNKERLRVFRYRSDLNTVSLDDGLAKELDDARWLIVICSPNSAQSEWVGKEIKHFIDTGRRDHILPFIIDGTSYSDDEKECLNPVLKEAFPTGDILGVNINDYGDDPWIYRKRKALVRTVSLLIEVSDAYSYLWNRYRLRYWEGIAAKLVGAVVVLALIFYAWLYNQSFNCQVRLNDQTAANEFLEAPDSFCLDLVLDNEQKTIVLTKIKEIGSFKNIPGKFANKDVHLKFHAYGYETIDTLVSLERNELINIPIRRDDTYGILSGSIIDENGHPIAGATIEAEGYTAVSATDGTFEIHISEKDQKPYPHVRVIKTGYQTEEYQEQPIGKDWQIMLIKK